MKERSFRKFALAGVLLCMAVLFAAPAHAYRVKVSLPGSGLPGCPNNEGSVIKVSVTDATIAKAGALFNTSVAGDQGFTDGEGVTSSSIYLMCNGKMVRTDHSAITFTTDENGVVSFPSTTISSFNQDDIDLIVPTIDTAAVWCSLYIPENGGCTWEYPNGLLLDRVPPRVDGGRLKTKAMTAFPGGNAFLEWSYSDGGTPGDPDGENGNACPGCSGVGCYTCNKSDTRSQWELFRRKSPASYGTSAIGSTNGELTYITDAGQTTTKDRMITSPDTFCYALRIQDTAGNWSVEKELLQFSTDTIATEKCIRTDGKPPQVVRMDYFTTYDPVAGFSDQFPNNFLGKPVVSSNPCRFNPATCDISSNRYIEMKITMNEPLFDGNTPYGYTKIRGDGFDNDNDGFIDEEPGGFDGVDNDGDGYIDEDVAYATTAYGLASNDLKDNDGDGYVDEEPNGLDTKDNDGDGQTDEDYTSRYCDQNLVFNRAQSVNGNDICYGMPKIYIEGTDSEGTVSGSAITWVCTQDGVTTHPDCVSLTYGQTVYRYRWRVGRAVGDVPPIGLENGEYKITLTATDGVGNTVTKVSPLVGSSIWMDNTAPYLSIKFYSDSTFVTTFLQANHDNNSATPIMAVADAGKVYIGLYSYEDAAMTLAEPFGATPTAYVFMPDAQIPEYMGTPQPGNSYTLTTYHACGQTPSCDVCTGNNCTPYNASTNPCETFKTCFTIDPATMNDGYAAVTVKYRDRHYNRWWHETDAQAIADQADANPKASDDTGLDGLPGTLDLYEGDGIPTFVSMSASDSVEQDIRLNTTQFFAIDTTPPATPSISFPITPCNGQVARANGFCTEGNNPVNNPSISWKTLNNGLNDDGDSTTDEECIDGIDNDGDGRVDEDAGILGGCGGIGTQGWEISLWNLQVATSPDFATASIVKNTTVNGNNYSMTAMAERSASAPYYWHVAPFDAAGNKGPYNPSPPMATQSYFSFIIDVSPPKISLDYYSDAACSIPMATTSAGIPVTTDTESDPDTTLCLIITSDESIPWATVPTSFPLITTYQAGVPIASTSAIPFPSNSTTSFMKAFEIDAKGNGKIYNDGEVQVKITTRDVYGNNLTNGTPISGSSFIVDSAAPECIFSPIVPDPASLDNNKNGVLGEPTADGVTISFICNKYLGDMVNTRVIQNSFSAIPTMDDGLDNDCDGRIDEESSSSSDDDGDGAVGEDTGSSGEAEGSGCYIDMFATGTENTYTGIYDVVGGNYDGRANVFLGDTNPTSKYFLTDLIGSPVYADTYFSIDTNGPATPVQLKPVQSKILNTTLPQFRWTITRSSDLFMYRIELATASSFVNIAATANIMDDGVSTTITYDLTAGDIAECYTLYPSPLDCPGLSDNTYFWRVYAIDLAGNNSAPSLKLSFDVDTQPPAAPVFNAVTTPTTLPSSPLSGSTNPVEKNAEVSIYVTGNSGVRKYIGTVITDNTGKFTVGIDDDKDGATDEELMNGLDDDNDTLIDEDPPGIFLSEGQNIVEGQVKDAGGNIGTLGCSAATPFYDLTAGKCIITLDSGAPKFDILYYSDSGLTLPLPVINQTTNKQVAKAGAVYMKIRASEPLQGTPTFTVDQQGTNDIPITATTALNASNTIFFGSFAVNAKSDPAYLDGDATVIVKGTDTQGNGTPDGTMPTSGGYLTIDTTVPDFRITYWYDKDLREKLPRSALDGVPPLAKPGSVFMRISAGEALSSPPQVNIDHPGTADLTGGVSEALDSTATLYRYEYTVVKADGSNYIDGSSPVTIDGTDKAGNLASGATPVQGPTLVIDTTPPQPPTIDLAVAETNLTQVNVTGTVVVDGPSGIGEKYAKVEIFVRLKLAMSVDDLIDNDGDGRVDEEPGGADGIDNDMDNFIDEDTTANSCPSKFIWDPIYAECITALDNTKNYDGLGFTDASGYYSATVTGLIYGIDYLYGRATDMAGNTSAFNTTVVALPVKTAPAVTLSHTFDAGWNLVGVPLQPSLPTPQAAFRLGTIRTFQYKNGAYYYSAGQDPIAPGMCYWIYFDEETTITTNGIASTTNVVNLKKGWNLISLPYNTPATWNSEIKVSGTSGTYSIDSTDGRKLVDPGLFTYDGNTAPVGYVGPVDPDGTYTLEQWKGFAINALQDCQLVFPSLFSP